MAATRPEVLVSQLLDNIATTFQWLPHMLGLYELNGTIKDTDQFIAVCRQHPHNSPAAILDFRLPITSSIVGDGSFDILDHENTEVFLWNFVPILYGS